MIREFLVEVNARYHRAFQYYPGLKHVEYLPEKQ
jgi:hypothetical protein